MFESVIAAIREYDRIIITDTKIPTVMRWAASWVLRAF